MARRSPIPFVALVALAGASLMMRAQPANLPPRPAVIAIDTPSPRVTGNSFVAQWRAEDFGGGSGNSGVVQHPVTGFMYVGNSQGVLEFDGARWQLVPLPNSGAVLALAVDARGRVWASAENEIVRLDPDASGTWQAVTVVHPLPDGEAGAMEQALATKDGSVWFRGLQNILRIGPDDRVATWRTGERFGHIWWMDGAVHTRVSEREIARLEPGGSLKTILNRDTLRVPANRPSPFRVFAARELHDGEWLLLTALGAVRWQTATRTWRPFAVWPGMFRESEAVAATFLDDGSMVFVTTRPGGLVVLPDGRIERLLDRLPAVMNPRITGITADREGGLWITSRDYIARMQLRSALARHEGAQGLQGNPRQLLRHNDALLVAHSAGVSQHVEWPGAFPPVDGLHRGADAIAVVGDHAYVAATGLVELVDDDRRVRPWSDLAVTTLTGVRSLPGVILAGDAQGVWAFQLRSGDWKADGRLQNLSGGVTALFDAGDGSVWAATSDGRIWRMDFRGSPSLAPPLKVYGAGLGVPASSRVGKIHFFHLGARIVATSASWTLQYDVAADRFVALTGVDGIATPQSIGAEAVGRNADGTCWLRLAAPDRRLLRLTEAGPGRWRATEFPVPQLRELAAVSLLEDGRTLWFAGKDLLVSIDLDWTPPIAFPPLVARVRRVVSDQARVVWADSAPTRDGPLTLAAGESSVRFQFAAPSFITDHRGRPIVQYRSQLVGLEHEWSVRSPEPWRDFTRLPAGSYTFRVEAADGAGRTSAEATLRLNIIAPWWRTRWAWLGYAGVAGLTLLSGVTLRTRALRRRAEKLEATVAARTEELRRSNAELARLHRLELDEKAAARLAEEEARLEVLRYQLNPHFLYNALNSIYSLVLTTPPAAANMVLRLADFCRIALDRRHEEHTTVGAEFDKLSIYLEIEKVRWGDTLEITVEADALARRAVLPPFLLLPLVENAIKYGSATSPSHLHVKVTARIEGANLILVVANTGEWVERTSDKPPFSGIGLNNVRQRLRRSQPEAHEVIVEAKEGWVVVTLRLSARQETVVGGQETGVREQEILKK